VAKFTITHFRLAFQVLRTVTPLILSGVHLRQSQLQKQKTALLRQRHRQLEEPSEMIFDIYEQRDLFRIAGCGRQATLKRWLNVNQIPYLHNSKNEIIAHKKAVATGLGVQPAELLSKEVKPEMYLGDLSDI